MNKSLLLIILLNILPLGKAWFGFAQPKTRRTTTAQKQVQQKSGAQALTTRAQISFPTAQPMKDDVVWRRDIYREIDLTKSANSGLYYPVEPVGSQMNLFTYLFRLLLSGQVKAYEYRLDGNESFEPDAQVKPLALLDNYHIYYERKDGKLKLDNSDIPSREVKSYYIKECSYFDQSSATFHTKVIALCPIMSREDDFGDGASKYPLFWMKYDDVAPFLSKQTIMVSDLNNAATMSVDDYFLEHQYSGKIYKTNNKLGQTLSQYCPTDSAMAAEQKKIEKEIITFEKNIWGDQARKDSLDSIAKAQAAQPKVKKSLVKKNRRAASTTATDSVSTSTQAAVKSTATAPKKTKTKATKTTRQKTSSSSGSSAARVSVRRQRH